MSLNKQVLTLCEELFGKISEKERNGNKSTGIAVQDLYDYLTEEADGFGDDEEPMMIAEVKERLDEILVMISDEEKDGNPAFVKQFDELREHLDYLHEELTGQDGDLYSNDELLEDVEWEGVEGDEDEESYEMDEDFDEVEDEWD